MLAVSERPLSSTYSATLPIVDYKIASANQDQLMAQFQRTPDYTQGVADYQAGVSKITTVDQFLNNYKVLKVALAAYGMSDQISSKGLLKELLTENPSGSTALAQRMGNQSYLAFAQAYWSLSEDGGAGLQSPASINNTISRYTQKQYAQWLGNKDNDPALATALNARQTLQDAVNVTNVGALYAQYQSQPNVAQAVGYYQRNIGNVKTAADLINDPKLLNVALAAYGIDPTTVSADTVQALLTQTPTDTTSVAYNNPAYQAFANAFSALNDISNAASVTTSSAINSVVANYQQRGFAQALATNTDAQNIAMFGSAGAKKVTQILGDAKTEAGYGLATGYYAANIAKVRTVAEFAADKQLAAVAEGAYGFSNLSADTLNRLLTEDPTASTSLAQTSPQFSAFAKAFSFYGPSGGASLASQTNIAAVQTGYVNNQLEAVLQSDIAAASAQSKRDTDVHENASAPLDLYQMLGNSDVSTAILGAYGQPTVVGSMTPDQQVEAVTHAGFTPQSLNSPASIDTLMQRYLANYTLQNGAPASPLSQLFQPSDPTQITPLDLSFLTAGASSSDIASSPTAYLINLFS
jgi:hypothetical protein